MINSNRLYIDDDLDDSIFSGVNIVLVGLSFQLAPGKDDFNVDTSGLNALPAAMSDCAAHGKVSLFILIFQFILHMSFVFINKIILCWFYLFKL